MSELGKKLQSSDPSLRVFRSMYTHWLTEGEDSRAGCFAREAIRKPQRLALNVSGSFLLCFLANLY